MVSSKASDIREKLGNSLFGRQMEYHSILDSTNARAKQLARKGAPDGTLVLTEAQTAGRGRLGRQWISPAGLNLLFSVLLRPDIQAENVFTLTMASAVAVCEGVEQVSDVHAMIKWPNDIYVRDRKLGGVLTEFSVSDQIVEYVIIGLGLNVNWSPGKDDAVLYPSTSVKLESGKAVDRQGLLVSVLKGIEANYRETVSGRVDKIYRAWNERSMLLKRRVEIACGQGLITGEVVRIDEKGALVIVDEGGREQRILNGDVSVMGMG